MKWKAFVSLCWLRGHDDQPVIDCDSRRSFNCCTRCGHEFQYDFQKSISKDWIGFCDEAHRCPLCFGWKPKEWDRCDHEICTINPNGMLRLLEDGTLGYDPDSRRRRAE